MDRLALLRVYGMACERPPRSPWLKLYVEDAFMSVNLFQGKHCLGFELCHTQAPRFSEMTSLIEKASWGGGSCGIEHGDVQREKKTGCGIRLQVLIEQGLEETDRRARCD